MSVPANEFDENDLNDPNGNEPDETQRQRDPVRAQIRRLEKRVKELEPFEGRAGKAERQLEMVKAGIDLNDPKAKYFVSGYDGEITADAIKAAATEAGLIAAPPPPEGKEAAQRLDQLNASTTDVPRPGEQDAEYQNRMRAATSEAEALAVMREFGKPITSNNN